MANSNEGNQAESEASRSTVASTENNSTDQQPQQQQESPWKGILFRIFIFWFISNLFRGRQQPSSQQGPSFKPATNLFKPRDYMDLYVYVSEDDFMKPADFDDPSLLVWTQKGLQFGNWSTGENGDGSFTFSTKLTASEQLMNNGSLYAHVFITRQHKSPNPKSPHYKRLEVVNRTKQLTAFKKRRISKTVNLLSGKIDPEAIKAAEIKSQEIINYWHPNLTINVMDDQTPWTPGAVPPPMDEFIIFDNITNSYFPLLYLNSYWNLQSDYMPINETTPELDLHLTYSPISLFKWQMYESQRVRQKWFSVLGDDMQQTDEEQDTLKRTMVETNPYLLGITIVVSLIHTVFEFLAFKNDIQFWRSRKTLEGLSVRSVFFNVFQSVVVLLYVFDNDTNTMVIISCFIGLLIEIWKINKVVDVKFERENRVLGILPRIKFTDKESYIQSSTRIYDEMAFKYLSWLLFPLLLCYAVYSLLYLEHKGWYSWVLSMLYGFLLTFGFITMTPQLFINYKLKSVAHLPWRMMTYKALNTFIDDLFAFVIKMPMMYRIGCFRDDIVFFIFLYQRWIYKIDPKRVNEFGVSGEDLANGGPVEETKQDGEKANTSETPPSDKKND
ncbi:cleft lip and palate transmembrane protein 1 homolog [Exaiptasia diaphana]|uniref:Cleft lip and palate associated transmembrane protein n=1 Tax=Exaiptasia diaphana TaxID=2652724 RepID=A0A913XCH8_EXADI|nr:cleft lip and palate transmembrane protein 1 homolog [Exaiptasia diaphana]KXJ13308.1 Cleft lip and palate transmembrane protein 1-like [Exaiptasia diaphana]